MGIADWVGVYGAFVGTLALGWEIYRACTSGGKLKLECSIEDKFQEGLQGTWKEGKALVWSVTNVGSQRIIAWQVRIDLGDEKCRWLLPCRQQLPKPLEPGEYYFDNCELDGLLDGARFIEARDTLKRSFLLPRGEFKALMVKYEEHKRSRAIAATSAP